MEQQCWVVSEYQRRRALAPPTISAFCSEARDIACRWGGIEKTPIPLSLRHVWMQRKTDVALCCWKSEHGALFDRGREESAAEDFVQAQTIDHPDTPICLLAEHFHEFFPTSPKTDGDLVMVCASDPRTVEGLLHGVVMPCKIQTDAAVAMEYICIHGAKRDVLDSGLFGLLRDTPSQLVDYDDVATLARSRALFDKCKQNKRRKTAIEKFDAIASPDFRGRVKAWLPKAYWVLLVFKWLHVQENETKSSIFTNPQQVFDNTIYDDLICWRNADDDSNCFKKEHPWVVEERNRLPKLTPKIWFNYCTEYCPVKEKCVTPN